MLHVVVGHGLPRYFLNTLHSVRATAPDDHLLVIDNASPDAGLRQELRRIAEEDDQVDLILRSANDLTHNRKVGSLYDAYQVAFDQAIARGFDLVHLLQGDFQMLWWDAELVRKSLDIFNSNPQCVNMLMQFLSRDNKLTDALVISSTDGLARLSKYGLCDTGLYHLGRWQARSMRFGIAEQDHGKRYLNEGLEVLCHPWPTDAPIPWPAVIRNGVQRGREVATPKPFLLRSLPPEEIARVKGATWMVWLEDVCIPWGWACLTPMWVTGLDSMDYWALRYRDARRNGLRHLLPRLDLRGMDNGGHRKRIMPYRPSLFRLLFAAPVREALRRLERHRKA